jgi:hypothetical protein
MAAIGINVLRMHQWLIKMDENGQFSKNKEEKRYNGRENICVSVILGILFSNICYFVLFL